MSRPVLFFFYADFISPLLRFVLAPFVRSGAPGKRRVCHPCVCSNISTCADPGVLLCAEQSVVEVCSVDPESEPRAEALPRPVRLDPLTAEVTPNSVCSLSGQPPPHLSTGSCRTCPVGCFPRETKPLFSSSAGLRPSEEALMWLQGLSLSAVCYSVSSGSHCLGL